MRLALGTVCAAGLIAAVWALPAAFAAGPGDVVTMVEPAQGGGPAGCGCSSGAAHQQPPWHGNVRAAQCNTCPNCCRGSSVYQAHPFQQLHWRQYGCVTLPPCFPRLHTLCRDGYLPSPIPPAVPRCHQCGAAIEGGF